ncbi:LacI family DNA-binding transcriptional regulator [Paenibacillus sp. WQ 127069]|uniref:LacI family DNA-binding transcriptional regulator n=1 Tax=Paenibacillus baimaensis TaxID=2982185 RepID=A0ABT2UP01_9BACL|nr:LacI family DNA-binding transcriptional regulator [Paenibacillus sp. WQ 127069]MCU6796385.1 LacI family DNA-binding transcriptional regulator [Paenibacillus sp. WQ 127069]
MNLYEGMIPLSSQHTKITMQLIADRLGVSKYTVSQALSGKIGVSEATRAEVEAMARALGYRIKSDKRSAYPKPPKTVSDAASDLPYAADLIGDKDVPHTEAAPAYVAIWVHDAQRKEPSFWSRVLGGVILGCSNNGWQTQVLSSDKLLMDNPMSSPLTDITSPACLGSVVLGTLPIRSLHKLAQLHQANDPIILVDHEEPLIRADCILNANLEAARLACRRIISQGCKRIVFVGKDLYSVSFQERWWGCRQALDEYSRQLEGYSLRKWTISYGQPIWEQQLAKRVGASSSEELPDGFVCANDEIALKLLKLLQEQSIPVPSRCKVIGIDNIDASASSTPPLTTVELAKELLGTRAVEALERNLTHPSVHSEKVILSARLITRGSG